MILTRTIKAECSSVMSSYSYITKIYINQKYEGHSKGL